jgi:hypothetical protein
LRIAGSITPPFFPSPAGNACRIKCAGFAVELSIGMQAVLARISAPDSPAKVDFGDFREFAPQVAISIQCPFHRAFRDSGDFGDFREPLCWERATPVALFPGVATLHEGATEWRAPSNENSRSFRKWFSQQVAALACSDNSAPAEGIIGRRHNLSRASVGAASSDMTGIWSPITKCQ